MTDDAVELPGGVALRVVGEDEWSVVAWLWQAFRQDLSPVVQGLPYADGRYRAALLERFPSADGIGYLASAPHPNTGEDAPVAFGGALALAVLARHPGSWEIGFQHDNPAAGAFWRRVADAAFGRGGWTETEEAVPGRPLVPPDHFIRTTSPAGGATTLP